MSVKYNILFSSNNDELVLNTNKHYIENFFDTTNKINLSAIIGENGSGKSSLLKLIMLLLYNDFDSEHIGTVKDCFLIIEMDNKFYKIGSGNQNFSLKVNDIHRSIEEYSSKFYTIYFNYMLDSLKDNAEEHWIDEVYHKSDNYSVPLLLEPYKKYNNIDINNLNYLTRQRMISNKKHIFQNSFLQKIFSPNRVNISININKIINIFKSTIEGEEAYRFIHKDYQKDLLRINKTLNDISETENLIIVDRNAIKLINSKLHVDTFNELTEKVIKELNNEKVAHGKQLANNEKNLIKLKQSLKDDLYDMDLYILNNLYIANKVDKLKKLGEKINRPLIRGDLVFRGQSGSAHKLHIEYIEESHSTLKLRNAMKFYDFCLTSDLIFHQYTSKMSIEEEVLDFLPGWFEVEFIDEKERTLASLSAGEKSFYILLTTLIYQIDNIISRQKLPQGNYNNILILLDEADLGLHPKWQRQYLYNIVETLKPFSSDLSYHIICTSHSPFIVSDLPKDNILFLNNGKVDTLKDNEYTFGENIHTLLNDSFFMQKDMMMGQIAENKIENAFKFFEEIFENNKKIEEIEKITNDKKTSKNQKTMKELTTVKKSLKKKYEENYKYLINLGNIIGGSYLKIAFSNSLEECNKLFDIAQVYEDNKHKILQALKKNPELVNKWLKDVK